MYKIYPFEEKDSAQIIAFMEAHPFITLIGFDGTYPVATQVPVQIYQHQDKLKLVGHVMNKTDHHLAYEANENVLAIFSGAHAYISASVYAVPAAASTWNYKTVQAKGKIKMLDVDATREIIKNLTNSFEDPASSPAAFHKMEESYIEQHLKAISGFEIEVVELHAVFKMSQNHSEENRKAIVADLEEKQDLGAQVIAAEMKQHL
jgi:transcriptional regulator